MPPLNFDFEFLASCKLIKLLSSLAALHSHFLLFPFSISLLPFLPFNWFWKEGRGSERRTGK
jgi:hypothetical protein